jgi:hypothetical protein
VELVRQINKEYTQRRAQNLQVKESFWQVRLGIEVQSFYDCPKSNQVTKTLHIVEFVDLNVEFRVILNKKE